MTEITPTPAEVIEVALSGSGGAVKSLADIRIDKLEEALNEHPDTRLIYVIPNFQNPTGKAWPLERRKEFLELLKKYLK